MKAITIWEPYATAIAIGLKKYETRTWKTNYRGPIAIHASIKKTDNQRKSLAEKYNISNPRYGKIVAIANLTDCILMEDKFILKQSQKEKDLGNWEKGNYAWKLENIKIIEDSDIIKGKQGLWNLYD